MCLFDFGVIGVEYKSKFMSVSSTVDEDSSENSHEKEGSSNTADNKKQSKTYLLSEICTFVDMVPPFRDLATKSMGPCLKLKNHNCMSSYLPGSRVLRPPLAQMNLSQNGMMQRLRCELLSTIYATCRRHGSKCYHVECITCPWVIWWIQFSPCFWVLC